MRQVIKVIRRKREVLQDAEVTLLHGDLRTVEVWADA